MGGRLIAKLERDEDRLRAYRQRASAARGDIRVHSAGRKAPPSGASPADGDDVEAPAAADVEIPWLRGPQGSRQPHSLEEEAGEAATGDVAHAADRLVPVTDAR